MCLKKKTTQNKTCEFCLNDQKTKKTKKKTQKTLHTCKVENVAFLSFVPISDEVLHKHMVQKVILHTVTENLRTFLVTTNQN